MEKGRHFFMLAAILAVFLTAKTEVIGVGRVSKTAVIETRLGKLVVFVCDCGT